MEQFSVGRSWVTTLGAPSGLVRGNLWSMDVAGREVERAMIVAFVSRTARARLLTLLDKPARRSELTARLAHFSESLDPRYAHPVDRKDGTVAALSGLLLEAGAPATCHVMSDDEDIDGQELPLEVALQRVVASGSGALIACVAGRLGLYESEEIRERYILRR